MLSSLEGIACAELGDSWRVAPLADGGNPDDFGVESQLRTADAVLRAVSRQRAFLQSIAAQSIDARRRAAGERLHVALRERDEILSELHALRASTPATPSAYARQWAALHGELSARQWLLAHVLAVPEAALAWADLSPVLAAADTWHTFATAARHALGALERAWELHVENRDNSENRENAENGENDWEVGLPDPGALAALLETVAKMQLQCAVVVNRERCRMRQRCEDTAELFKDQRKLLLWCDEQSETVGKLKSLKDLRDFNASFHTNANVMDANFLVLLERGEALPANRAVREALVDVNRAWIELTVSVYRKIHKAIRDAHTASRVEDMCVRWEKLIAPRLHKVLTDACALTANDRQLLAVHQECSALLNDFESHQTIVQHVSNFSVREDCVAPHEETLCDELLTRLTLLTLTFRGEAAYEGQREYTDRLRELEGWVDAHSTSSAYADLLERVERLRSLAEDQLRLLTGDKSTVTASS